MNKKNITHIQVNQFFNNHMLLELNEENIREIIFTELSKELSKVIIKENLFNPTYEHLSNGTIIRFDMNIIKNQSK